MDPLTKTIADVIADHTVSFFGAYLPIPEEAAGMLAEGIVEAIRADRTITTVEELDALPVGSVVLDAAESDPRAHGSRVSQISGEVEWVYPGDDDPQSAVVLPVRVLYRPDEDGE